MRGSPIRTGAALQISVKGRLTTVLFLMFGKVWLAAPGEAFWLALLFVWLFATILWSAIRVVHHAECLAVKLGEPYGTLILTLSVITIEVVMCVALYGTFLAIQIVDALVLTPEALGALNAALANRLQRGSTSSSARCWRPSR